MDLGSDDDARMAHPHPEVGRELANLLVVDVEDWREPPSER
jgi:hypothetical protein